MANDTLTPAPVITPDALLKHWQGHRGLTRRVIEAFPDDQLFTFTLGGMRPFSALAWEFIRMAVPTVQGIVSGDWSAPECAEPATKEEILRLWDADTAEIDRLFPRIAPHRFQETELAFGQWEGPVWNLLFYVIDNEIHHRGQGYVYLRALGIEPPAFYDRQ